jgi:hypothetical protein
MKQITSMHERLVKRGLRHNPIGVDEKRIPFTQGSSCVAALGWRPESLWDSPKDAIMAAVAARIHHSSFTIHQFPPV